MTFVFENNESGESAVDPQIETAYFFFSEALEILKSKFVVPFSGMSARLCNPTFAGSLYILAIDSWDWVIVGDSLAPSGVPSGFTFREKRT